LSHLVAVVILAALIVVPATGLVLILYPPATLSFTTRLAAVITFGYLVPAVVGYLLAVFHVLYPIPVAIAVLLVTIVAWFLAIRRTPLRAISSGLVAEFREDTWPNVAGLLMIVAIGIVHLGLIWRVDLTIPFRYYSDGMQLAETHEVPRLSIEYGRLYPTTVSKVMLNSFNAVLGDAIPNSIMATSVLAWFVPILLAASVWALARRLGLRYTGPLAAMALIAKNGDLNLDLSAYRAESFIRPITLSALVLAMMAVQTGRRRDAVIAALALGIAASGHLVVFVVAVIFLVAYVIARTLPVPKWSVIKPLLIQLSVMGGITAIVVIVTLVGARGDLGFEGASGPVSYPLVQGRYDPTIYLKNERLVPPHPKSEVFYFAPDQVVGSYFSSSTGTRIGFSDDDLAREYDATGTYLLLGGLLVAAILQLIFVKNELRYIGLTSWLAMAAIIAVALFFSFRFNLWILSTFGLRRLFVYSLIPLSLWALSLVELPLGWIRRREVLAAISIALVLAAGIWLLPKERVGSSPPAARAPGVKLMSWLRNETPCGSRVVTNRRTLGAFEALTGRVNVSEGMGPFLRPDMLGDLVETMDDIHRLYADPSGNVDVLDRHGIDYVIAIDGGGYGYPVGMPRAHFAELQQSDVLELVESGRRYQVFEAVDGGDAADDEEPQSWAPCRSGDLEPTDPFHE
jgi:hypothetical protein